MEAALRNDQGRVCVRIAIPAQMPACVVCSDVTGQVACAFGSGSGLSGRVQPLADRLFIIAEFHTPAAVRTEPGKIRSFGTGPESHAVCRCDPDHFFSKCQPLVLRDLFGFREIPSDLWVQIYETDYCSPGVALKGGRHSLECAEVVLHRIFLGNENRIEAPADRIHADNARKLFEILEQFVFVLDRKSVV